MASPSSPALQQLHHLDTSSPDFHAQLYNILCGQEYVQCVPNLKDDDLIWLVDYLDKALDRLDLSSPVSRKCQHELRSICSTSATLPTSYMLSTGLLDIDPVPFASGGFGDAYRGTLNGSRVCIKRIRTYHFDHGRATVAFCREAMIWKCLDHPNILPLLGVTISPFQLISNWMDGGDLLQHVKNNPNADRLGLLCDVVRGLCYLHSQNVMHGDLKGQNILVDDSGRACVADFALAMVVKGEDSLEDDSVHGHTPRWTAPEVLNEGPYSMQADIFSFAMVMIEVFTGAAPFSDRPAAKALLAIVQGERPPRPTHPTFTENLWILMQRCWYHDPHSRPTALEILQILLTPTEPPAWKQLIGHTLPTNEHISLITSIFSNRNEVEVLGNLSGDDAQAFIDVIDEVLDSLPQQIYRRCLRYLYRICGRQVLLPKSLATPLCYNPTEMPQCRGGFADVWKGQYNGQEVAAKALRVSQTSNFDQIRRRFCKEVVMWNTLRHPNVLPLMGVTMTENQFVMVSEWMENGSINMYVKAHTDVNRPGLLGDVTTGLIYMHSQRIVHGDLKGANILINPDGHACIADFSLLTVISDQQTFLSTCIGGGTTPWMSPELLDPESFGLKKCRLTKESDCYALGMVIYEILSGKAPFAPSPAPVVKILCGERPKKPQGAEGARFTDGIWGMLELCWKPQPNERPSLNKVLRCLQNVAGPPRPSFYGGNVETDAGDQSDATTASDSSTFSPFCLRSRFTHNYPCGVIGASLTCRVTMPKSSTPPLPLQRQGLPYHTLAI
ncbi:kinase-like protein [Thelephora ganbajun]|uniref:Kinase-like protein n=1 Tax=Thelephora ganbajun TaxID=370292 RepID=A0ACB6Z7B2_THEGA|nr:kinase-like protein [Thelephora ganbajun]